MQTQYQMNSRLQTNGWIGALNVNAENSFNMTPAQVAIQAGNVDEFKLITNHPEFDPTSMGPLGVFFAICKHDSIDGRTTNYKEIRNYFDTEFSRHFELCPERKVWIRTPVLSN